MINKIIDFVKQYDMIQKGDCVVCGLSGGADSVCLLLSLMELSRIIGFSVEALHVNHSIRGDESDRDENFCRKLCESLNVPFTAVRCNVPEYAEKNSLSDEEAARILRYKIFSDCSCGKKLATAHNANDNLETAVLNLARGTALKGISGIPPVRDNIIRPLLTVTRNEIENFLKEKNQPYVTDSTNLSDDYTRNKIRHCIIPLLMDINKSVTETSVKTFASLRSENDFIENQVNSAMETCRQNNKLIGLAKYDGLIRKRCLARIISENSLPYSYDRLNSADNILVNGGKLNLSGDIFLVSDGNSCEIKKIKQKDSRYIQKDLIIGENSIFLNKKLICEIIECDNLKKILSVHKNLTFYLLDYDKIIGRAILRNRRFGDRIQLKGRNFTSSVKKLINEKIPPQQRDSLHFIEDDIGTVFAENIGISQRVAPDENTRKLLKITVRSE
ncbi:MAG TPA: tRNA lysidine(34) synthetase TilS [Ruminococcus sp.]|nr:tRNA lysidine(34) synthetase TilS [Ruminococcus sp.]